MAAKVVDGLGCPVSNAIVDIYWSKSFSANDVRKIDLVKLVSDRNGDIKGTYNESSIPHGEDTWVDVSKDGYSGYSTTGLRAEFVLKREFGIADVPRIAALTGDAQVRELREFLCGDFDHSGENANDLIFVHENRLRGSLRELLRDPKVGIAAGETLAFIGVPEDVRLFIDHAPAAKKGLLDSQLVQKLQNFFHAPAAKKGFFDNRWVYGVVSALLEPTTNKEWDFLLDCAANRYDDVWVDYPAIQTLKLIASPKSRQILQEVAKVNKYRANDVKQALSYIDSTPAPSRTQT